MTALEQAAVNFMRLLNSNTAPEGTPDSDEWPIKIVARDEDYAGRVAVALTAIDVEIKKLGIDPR